MHQRQPSAAPSKKIIHTCIQVAQTVKRLSTMQETRLRALGWEDPRRRKWQSTPVLLPGKSHGKRSLVGYSLWGCKESDMTDWLHWTDVRMRLCFFWGFWSQGTGNQSPPTAAGLRSNSMFSCPVPHLSRGNLATISLGRTSGQPHHRFRLALRRAGAGVQEVLHSFACGIASFSRFWRGWSWWWDSSATRSLDGSCIRSWTLVASNRNWLWLSKEKKKNNCREGNRAHWRTSGSRVRATGTICFVATTLNTHPSFITNSRLQFWKRSYDLYRVTASAETGGLWRKDQAP